MSLLQWGIVFLVIALIAGLFGFTKVSGAASTAAKIVFAIFLILSILAFIGINIIF